MARNGLLGTAAKRKIGDDARGDIWKWKGVYQMWRAMEVAKAYPLEDAKFGTSIPLFFLFLFYVPFSKKGST